MNVDFVDRRCVEISDSAKQHRLGPAARQDRLDHRSRAKHSQSTCSLPTSNHWWGGDRKTDYKVTESRKYKTYYGISAVVETGVGISSFIWFLLPLSNLSWVSKTTERIAPSDQHRALIGGPSLRMPAAVIECLDNRPFNSSPPPRMITIQSNIVSLADLVWN